MLLTNPIMTRTGALCILTRSIVHGRTSFLRSDHNHLLQQCRSRESPGTRHFSFDLTKYPTILFRTVAESDACAFTREIFTNVHDVAGIPWWCTIIVSGAALKLYSMPLKIYQGRLVGRLETVKEEMNKAAERLRVETGEKQIINRWSGEKTTRMFRRELFKERKHLIEKYNCHPGKIIISGYLELPFWLLMSITWRTMSYGFTDDISSAKLLVSQMMTEGPFWCPNLTASDPTYILPVMILIIQLISVELGVTHMALLKKKQTKLTKFMSYLSRAFAVLSGTICAILPSAVAVFWFSTSSFNLLRDLLYMSPKFRRIARLPHENASPREVLIAFKDRIAFWSKRKVLKS